MNRLFGQENKTPALSGARCATAQKGKTNMKNMASQTQPVKTYSVQSQIGALFLMFDSNGDRWTSLLNISITTGIGLARLDSKADARYWKCEHFPGIGYCIPVPKLQEFLNSIPKSWVLVTREFEFSWVLTHAARVLAGFTPKTEQAVTPLLPEVVEAPKSNRFIHSMPMLEVKAAAVVEGLRTFAFDHMPVRVVERDGEPWWFIADICAVLEISNTRDAGSRLDADEKGVALTDTPGGPQQVTILNESGLYSLILGSRKPEAKVFKKWITSEVLPAIRKTGAYSVESALPQNYLEALKALVTSEESKAALTCRVQEQQATISTLAPKADGLDRLTITTQGTVTLTEAAKLLQQPPRKFTAWLQQIAWVYRSGKHLLPYQDRIHTGMMEHKVVVISEEISVPQAVITPNGLANLSARLGKVPA